ncbi:MAG: bifunctional methylenetetrahydrofolate dehydrogenase/methenyltetrahydrofolate cyclohydrolase FolD [Thaumarchaeota archaeon]|nr:bifunctional methylenetetrahydrofolate dehydrogenase/methenyltetrahydrofolate cyclohydrolase FolD [Nitrososphaerota archaeon]
MDGRGVASAIESTLKTRVQGLEASGVKPTLATILVGNDPASRVYVASKHKAAERVGIASKGHRLEERATEAELVSLINSLNADHDVNGILLQLPLPPHFDERKVLEQIDPEKDVDGLTPTNAGRLVYGQTDLIPCTPRGVMELLHHYQIPIGSSRAVIINRSSLVGKPLHHLLLNEDATVTVCHSKSIELESMTRRADILVTAVGRRPQFVVTEDMVKEGGTVIDVAMNRVDGKLMGDVDFEAVSRKASHITPVPGGVGPMTVIMLIQNTLIATERQNHLLVSPAR